MHQWILRIIVSTLSWNILLDRWLKFRSVFSRSPLLILRALIPTPDVNTYAAGLWSWVGWLWSASFSWCVNNVSQWQLRLSLPQLHRAAITSTAITKRGTGGSGEWGGKWGRRKYRGDIVHAVKSLASACSGRQWRGSKWATNDFWSQGCTVGTGLLLERDPKFFLGQLCLPCFWECGEKGLWVLSGTEFLLIWWKKCAAVSNRMRPGTGKSRGR